MPSDNTGRKRFWGTFSVWVLPEIVSDVCLQLQRLALWEDVSDNNDTTAFDLGDL